MNIKQAKNHLSTMRLMGVDFMPCCTIEKPIEKTTNIDLNALEIEHQSKCLHCTTATDYNNIVFGFGNPTANLMFVGEAPGQEEDLQGIPFVGAAGQKLNEIIAAMELTREEVYIANVVKVRPPNNRTPIEKEIQECGKFLKKQITVIKPKVIVALGSPAAKFLLNTTVGITKLRGHWSWYKDIPVMPTYHPAYLLRQYTKQTRKEVWSDMQEVIKKMKQLDK